MILYKYYSPAALSEERFLTLQNKQFYYSSVAQLNDPFDLYGGRCIVMQSQLLRHWLHILYTELYRQGYKSIELQTEVMKVFLVMLQSSFQFASCSFSRVSLDHLMWAHYASGNKGFCLEFEFSNDADLHKVLYVNKLPNVYHSKSLSDFRIISDIDNDIRQKILGKTLNLPNDVLANMDVLDVVSTREFNNKQNFIDSVISLWKPSSKQKKIRSEDFFNKLFSTSTNSTEQPIAVLDGELVKPLMCLKSQEWCYEQEERLITELQLNQKGVSKPWGENVTLRKIILGCNFEVTNHNMMEKILSLKEQTNAALYMVEATNLENFELSIKECNL